MDLIKPQYFKNLDAIRFFAALMVFLQHSIFNYFKLLPIQNSYILKLFYVLTNGGTGVSIFFVLSGFLITYLLVKEYNLNGKVDIKKFYIRRILRIWPLYFAVIFFSFVLYPLSKIYFGIEQHQGANIWYQLSFLSNFDLINIKHFCVEREFVCQIITWSVAIEEQFYLFWVLIFVFLPKRFWLASIGIIISISVIFRIINHNDFYILYFHTLSVLLDLGLGGMFAILVLKSEKLMDFFSNTSSSWHFLLFILAFLSLYIREFTDQLSYGFALGRIFTSILFALIITSQALTKNNSIFNLGNLTFAAKNGKYTYGLYLLHPIGIWLVLNAFKLLKIEISNYWIVLIFTAVSFIVSLYISKLSYHLFEIKFLKLKEKFKSID